MGKCPSAGASYGTVTVFTGSSANGQGHETTFAQIVADKLGIDMDKVEIVHGDTGQVQYGWGLMAAAARP